jgi:hypothetical protein
MLGLLSAEVRKKGRSILARRAIMDAAGQFCSRNPGRGALEDLAANASRLEFEVCRLRGIFGSLP